MVLDASKTRMRVAALRRKNPGMTATDIGRRLGISRQRAAQHLEALGLPTKVAVPPGYRLVKVRKPD